MTSQQSSQHDDLFAALTDALIKGGNDEQIGVIVEQYGTSPKQVESVVSLMRRLHRALTGVQPSGKFVRRLRHDLVGEPQYDVISRVRYLPARVHIAAGLAVLATLVLFNRRRLVGDSDNAGAILPQEVAL